MKCGIGLCQGDAWTTSPLGIAMCRTHAREYAKGIHRRAKQQRRYQERFGFARMDVPKSRNAR